MVMRIDRGGDATGAQFNDEGGVIDFYNEMGGLVEDDEMIAMGIMN
jgi:hypothetical protein